MSFFLLLNLVRLELRAASKSIQAVQIVRVGRNSNYVWLMKSSASELGLSNDTGKKQNNNFFFISLAFVAPLRR